MRYLFFLVLITLSGSTFAAPLDAVTNHASELKWDGISAVLTMFLILSVVFETALTPVFNWRWFLLHFEGKGAKTPITVMTAFIVFWAYDLDIVANLLTALGHEQNPNFGGKFLTALLISGGSDGVFRIFSKLGIRNPAERQKRAEEARLATTGPQATKQPG